MLAIIPARGGSKGVPGKNIRPLCGKPLIAHTIEAALHADTIDRVIVSTDDTRIVEVAHQYNADVPFMRPAELAQDNSLAIDTYIYTIERLRFEFGLQDNAFAVLLPTSPLRTAEDINNAVSTFFENDAESIVSCSELECPPEWAMKIDSQGRIRTYSDHPIENKNRQEIGTVYRPNGCVFILTYELIKKKYTYFSEETYAYVMPRERAVDIDTELDFKFAQFLMEQRGADS